VWATLNIASQRLAAWNGAVWLPADTTVASGAVLYAVAVNGYGEVAYGGSSAGATIVAGDTTVTLARGAAETYPVLTVTRAGGTYLQIRSLANETRNQRIYLAAMDLLDGESLTLDGQTLVITSNFGRPLAGLPGSTPLTLGTGDNLLTLFAATDGTATLALTYRPRYASFDAADDSA
jgi:hypothetical protein